MDLAKFRREIDASHFSSTTSLFKHVRDKPINMNSTSVFRGLSDCAALRALMVFDKYKALPLYRTCQGCKDEKAQIVETPRRLAGGVIYRYDWCCSGWQRKMCWARSVSVGTVLEGHNTQQWFGWLHFIALMTSDYRMKNIYQELKDGYGAEPSTVLR